MRPTRAKVRRSCFLKYGISSVAPWPNGCDFPEVKPASNNAGTSCALHGSVRHARARDVHLDQGFEPQEAARAVADEFDGDAAMLGLRENRPGGLIGTHAERRGVARHENLYRTRGAHARSRLDANSASKRSGVTRPCNCWSIIIEGPKAQLPRQYTGSRVIAPSLVVP